MKGDQGIWLGPQAAQEYTVSPSLAYRGRQAQLKLRVDCDGAVLERDDSPRGSALQAGAVELDQRREVLALGVRVVGADDFEVLGQHGLEEAAGIGIVFDDQNSMLIHSSGCELG